MGASLVGGVQHPVAAGGSGDVCCVRLGTGEQGERT